jgi:hypothetical protein
MARGKLVKWLLGIKMSRILLVRHNIVLYIQCIALMLVSHTCTFAIDSMELELEESAEQAQVEAFTNLVWNQGKPGAFNHAHYLLI